MKKYLLCFASFLFFSERAATQVPPDSVTVAHSPSNKKKLILVTGVHAAFWAGSYLALNKAWYADYPRTSFHTFNDNNEWLQMDKAGHVWTSYQVSRASAAAWRWGGLSANRSAAFGGLSAIAYQSIIEIQDAYSAEWGFSWGDMIANFAGAGAFVAQEIGWQQQKLLIKLSYSGYAYPSELRGRRNQLFGTSLPERILKDYNSQTYWVSGNLSSLFNSSRLPRWLNISAGYAADGMLGGFENKWTSNGNSFDRKDIPRVRRWLLSADVDFTRIRTRSKLLRTMFFVVNAVKIPAPAIEFNSKDQLRFHLLYF